MTDTGHLQRPLHVVVDVARRSRRAQHDQIPRIILAVRLLGIAAADRLRVITRGNALHCHRHLRHAVRGQVTCRTVHRAGDRYSALALDGYGLGCVILNTAAGLKQRALLDRACAGDGQAAVGKGRGLALQAGARIDVAVQRAVVQIFRVKLLFGLVNRCVRALHPQADCG